MARPLGQLQAGAGEDVAKACVFPLARVAEAVEVEVPDVHSWCLVRLDHGVGGALDAPLHAQGAQQVAHERGLACAQVAMQGDEGIAQAGLRGQAHGEARRVVLVVPLQRQAVWRFYNRVLMVCSSQLVPQIQGWARELGFSQIKVAGVDLSSAEPGLMQWLAQGFHGEMHYMAAHGLKRARPAELVPGTVSVITARMDYLPRAMALDRPRRLAGH